MAVSVLRWLPALLLGPLLPLVACSEAEPAAPSEPAPAPAPPKPKAPSCGDRPVGAADPAADAKLTWPPEAPPHPAVVAAGATCLPALERCFAAAHAADAGAAGRVDVTLTLTDGGVTELRTAGAAPDALQTCVRDRLSMLRVGPGAGSEARLSVVFAWEEVAAP